MNERYVPQYLDVPERYLFFSADEAIVVIVPLIFMTFVANFLVGLALGFACLFGLRKFKQGGPLYRLVWRAYWLLPPGVLPLRRTPPSFMRHMAG